MRPLSSRKGTAALEHELRRARPGSRSRGEADRGVEHPRAQLGVERDRRRLLEHLLVPTLHRAIALPEREDGAVCVGEQLDLDVPGRSR